MRHLTWISLLLLAACSSPTAPEENPLADVGCLERLTAKVLVFDGVKYQVDLITRWRIASEDSLVSTTVALNSIPYAAEGDTVQLILSRFVPINITPGRWDYLRQRLLSIQRIVGSYENVRSGIQPPFPQVIRQDLHDPRTYWISVGEGVAYPFTECK